MKIFILNNPNSASCCAESLTGAVLFQVPDNNLFQKLLDCLIANRDATIILDSELKAQKESTYQSLEGLRLAYQLRTNPELRFLGLIHLLGFLPESALLKSKYAEVIVNNEKKPASKLAYTGVYYYRYPACELFENSPLTELQWTTLTNSLGQLFAESFNRFEHGFRYVTLSGLGTESEIEYKKKELSFFYKNLLSIEKSTVISEKYIQEFYDLKKLFDRIITSINKENAAEIRNIYDEIKKNISQLKSNLTKAETSQK